MLDIRPAEPQRATWQWVLEFYDSYPDYEWWQFLKPFRQVVFKLSESTWADKFYASQSHETLMITLASSGEESFQRPLIVVHPGKDQVVIERYEWIYRWNEMDYDQPNGKPIHVSTSRMADAWDLLVPELEWLLSRSRRLSGVE